MRLPDDLPAKLCVSSPCSNLLYEVHRSHRWKVHGTIGTVYPGTFFHRRQRGIPMHPYENRSEIRALLQPPGC